MNFDLTLASDLDLIRELKQRGVACVISMVKQDETTGTEEALFGTFQNGPVKTCLGLSAVLFEKIQREATKTMSIQEINEVVYEAHHMVHKIQHGTV
jgi:hypothetical protein